MNNNDNNTPFVSKARFYGSLNKSAVELQDELSALKNNDIADRYSIISMYDIFGSDESK